MTIDRLVVEGQFPGPHLLITAGVHGDEYEPMEACRRLYDQLKDRSEELHGTITLIPVVNRPAFIAASRTGPDGMDLARVCPGSASGSTTEQIAHALSILIANVDYYVDLHNGGSQYSIHPFTGYVLHADPGIRQKQRDLARAFGLPIVWGTDPSLSGRTLSVARDRGIPSIYVELGGGGAYDPAMTNLAVTGCMNIVAHLQILVKPKLETQIRYHLEDFRYHSGHLQRLLPSPAEGFFIPCVHFEDRVKKGEVIGHIRNDLGTDRTSVEADLDGIIFILRKIPSVKIGDSLGAILPVEPSAKLQTIYD